MNQRLDEASVSLRSRSAHRLEDDLKATRAPSLQSSLRQFRASDPGGAMTTARSLGNFSGKRKIKQTVGKADKDFYQLTFGDLTDFRVTLRNRSRVDMFGDILDSQGQVVTFGGNRLSIKVKSGQAIENFYEALPSGTYFLRIRSQGSGKNTYQLQLSAANTFPSLPDCGCTP